MQLKRRLSKIADQAGIVYVSSRKYHYMNEAFLLVLNAQDLTLELSTTLFTYAGDSVYRLENGDEKMKTSILKLKFNNKNILLKYREDSVGDRSVIAQIFQSLDYYIEHWHQGKALIAYHKIQSALRPSLIIDAGANIGASTLYFLNEYENSFVFSIEPEKTIGSFWKITL